ncbi:hypothetical protein ACFY93_10330 [Streptomyces sp. NPDC008313]
MRVLLFVKECSDPGQVAGHAPGVRAAGPEARVCAPPAVPATTSNRSR